MESKKASVDCCPASSEPVVFPADLESKATCFKALGDEVRLKLLYLVRDQEVCVCDLTAIMEMAQGTLSHHLNVLLQAGLVTARKQGRWNYYQATPLALVTAFEVGERTAGSSSGSTPRR